MVDGLIANSKSGGDFLQLADGYFLFQFLGIEDAGQFDNFDKTGKVDKVHMNYGVYDYTTRAPYLIPADQPKAGEHGVFQNLCTKSAHTKATLRIHAAEIVGRTIEDGEDIGALLAANVGTFIVVQMGRDQNNKPGKLKNMMPDMAAGAPAPTPAAVPAAAPTAAAPVPGPAAAPTASAAPAAPVAAPAAPQVPSTTVAPATTPPATTTAAPPAPPTPPAPPAPPAPPTA